MKPFTVFLLCCTMQGMAQQVRKPVPWPFLQESNVMYHWRVERIIDTRLKQNTPLRWPVNPLHEVIRSAVENHRLRIYKDPALRQEMNDEELSLRLNHQTSVSIQHNPEDPYDTRDSMVNESFDWSTIQKFKIMEDWIFDKKEGRFFCRIVYIAPLYMPYAGGAPVPEQPLFYVRYYDPAQKDELCFRNVAVTSQCFNPKNESHRMSFDEIFEMRMFGGYITKQTNVFDNRFSEMEEYKDDPIAAMLAGEKAQQEMFEKEMDYWEH